MPRPPPPTPPELRAESPVTVRLRGAIALAGRFPLLAGVDLAVGAGEVVAIHGPNGSGKTSLLRLCAGLVTLGGGQGTILGMDLVRDRRALRRTVGLLGHHAALYDDLTVSENVCFAVRAGGGDPASVAPVLGRLGLDGRVERTAVAALSAGQRRRVALAVLLARRPYLWLLDEPHAALDPEARDLLDDLVRDATRGGATVLIASHDVDRSALVATRAVFMQGGRLVGRTAPNAQVGVEIREVAGVA